MRKKIVCFLPVLCLSSLFCVSVRDGSQGVALKDVVTSKVNTRQELGQKTVAKKIAKNVLQQEVVEKKREVVDKIELL